VLGDDVELFELFDGDIGLAEVTMVLRMPTNTNGSGCPGSLSHVDV
jgi:hypothetical protein